MSSDRPEFTRTQAQTQRAKDLRHSASKTERKLWPFLRRQNLGVKFRRQHTIGPYFGDYFAPQIKLAVEVDGDYHSERYDEKRDEYFKQLGIDTLRISVSDIDENLDGVVEVIEMKVRVLLAL